MSTESTSLPASVKFTELTPAHPPVNRTPTGLGVVNSWIRDVLGPMVLDSNRLAVAGDTNQLPLSAEVGPSLLSGAPGYEFANADGVVVLLTRDELMRLFRRELAPAEYFKLRETFGVFFEIHDDFYDEETGEALQPFSER